MMKKKKSTHSQLFRAHYTVAGAQCDAKEVEINIIRYLQLRQATVWRGSVASSGFFSHKEIQPSGEQARGPFHFLNITMSFSSSEWVQSAVCAGAGALAMYLLMKSDSEKDEVVAAPVKKQTDSISVVRTTTSIPRTFLPLPSSPRAEGAASLHLALRFLGSFKF